MEKISKQPGQRVKATEVAINNFREWVKFQKYADRYLQEELDMNVFISCVKSKKTKPNE